MERYKGKQPSNSNVPSYCQRMNGFECGSKSKAKEQLQYEDQKPNRNKHQSIISLPR